MSLQAPDATLARRELVLVAVTLVAFARLVERADALLAVALLPAAVLLAGTAALRGEGRRPVASLLIPAVLTGGTAAAIQLVPAGLALVPALALFAFGLDRVLRLEIRLLAQPTGTTEADRARLLAAAVLTAFVAFIGVAGLVPGGLPEPGASGAGGRPDRGLAAAARPGRRARRAGARVPRRRRPLRVRPRRRAVGRHLRDRDRHRRRGDPRARRPAARGPAALTLVFYLWDALHSTAPDRRREPRFVWETLLLGALAVVIVAWNLRLRA